MKPFKSEKKIRNMWPAGLIFFFYKYPFFNKYLFLTRMTFHFEKIVGLNGQCYPYMVSEDVITKKITKYAQVH